MKFAVKRVELFVHMVLSDGNVCTAIFDEHGVAPMFAECLQNVACGSVNVSPMFHQCL